MILASKKLNFEVKKGKVLFFRLKACKKQM